MINPYIHGFASLLTFFSDFSVAQSTSSQVNQPKCAARKARAASLYGKWMDMGRSGKNTAK